MFDPKTPWKSTQNRTKTTPRGYFFALKIAPLLLIDFWSVLAPKMPPFGHPFCSQNRSNKSSEIQVPQKSPQDHPISPQDRPKRLQEAPKRAPRSPKSTPRGLKNTKKTLQKRAGNPKGAASGLNKAKRHPDGN
jgi:hypothetical protein